MIEELTHGDDRCAGTEGLLALGHGVGPSSASMIRLGAFIDAAETAIFREVAAPRRASGCLAARGDPMDRLRDTAVACPSPFATCACYGGRSLTRNRIG